MEPHSARCSFCLKDGIVVGPLIEGPNRDGIGAAYICRDCAELCLQIFERNKQNTREPGLQTEDSYFGDFIEDEAAESPINAATQEMLKEKIDQVLKDLPYLEREVIKLRYGLGNGYTYTLEEISRIFEIAPERVQEIETKAVQALRSKHPTSSGPD
jgi:RNA polymerase sigma factor (sigma-70 family)